MEADFYRAFEDRHRGGRETIKARLRAYLPFVEPLAALRPRAAALDLGCGRGEWLEVAAEAGFAARGVDADAAMIAACREAGLSAALEDAVSALRAAPDGSVAIVSGFHLAEHIAFADLRALVREALRALQPGGLLILETPNPENIVVGTAGFYLDPTHQRPLPPGLLAFLPEHAGFHRTRIVRLQEAEWLRPETTVSILNVLRDTSADYAVVAQKAGPEGELSAFDQAFRVEMGLTLEAVATCYDGNLVARAQAAESLAEQARARAAQAEAAAREAEAAARAAEAAARGAETGARHANDAATQARAEAQAAQAEIHAILASKSWKLTAPLRTAAHAIKMMRRKKIP